VFTHVAQRAPFSHQRPFGRRRAFAGAEGCTTDAASGTYFIGVNYNNYASSAESAVLTGQDNEACDYDTAIAGGLYNIIGDTRASGGDASDSFIGGGYMNGIAGSESFILGGYDNAVSTDMAGIGAGVCNTVSGTGSFIGGGGTFVGSDGCDAFVNQISGDDAFIGGGDDNSIAAYFGIIGSGNGNSITSTGNAGALVGGQYNALSGDNAFIGGGDSNAAMNQNDSIAGGYENKVVAKEGAIAGGESNYVNGFAGAVPGGDGNEANGTYSFAAGYKAEALNNGVFAWADDTAKATLASTKANEFIARASGGFTFYTDPAQTTGAMLPAGSGAWASLSDRHVKTAIVPLDDASILARVARLPVSEWSYRSEHGVRHLGPMAQDFYAAFRVGEDDRHISSIDEDGVALAAIKALHAENVRLQSENARLQAAQTREHALLASLAAKVARLRP
jgi:hypothetical protein